jgi:hypothetical protein
MPLRIIVDDTTKLPLGYLKLLQRKCHYKGACFDQANILACVLGACTWNRTQPRTITSRDTCARDGRGAPKAYAAVRRHRSVAMGCLIVRHAGADDTRARCVQRYFQANPTNIPA